MSSPNPRQYVNQVKPGGWFSAEDFLNELTVFILASSTLKALAVATVDANGNQVSPVSVPTAVTNGTKTITTAGTPEKLVAVATTCKYVIVNADLGASVVACVGGSDVTAANGSQKGVILIPGNEPVRIDIDDVSKLWGDVQTNGGKIAFSYFN